MLQYYLRAAMALCMVIPNSAGLLATATPASSSARILSAAEPLPPLIVATLIYTLIIVLFVKAQRILERRIASRYGHMQP